MTKTTALIALSMSLLTTLPATKPEALRSDNHLSSLRNSTERNKRAKTIALFHAKTPAEVAQLVAEGANPNATLDGTSLFLNAWSGQAGLTDEQRLALFQAYLDNGTDVNLPSADKKFGNGFTFLHAAAGPAQNIAALDLAIANGANLNAKMMIKEISASTYSTVGYGDNEASTFTTETKSIITFKIDNATPLIATILNHSALTIDMATRLLNAGADATTVATITMTYEIKADNTRYAKQFTGTAAEFAHLMLENEDFCIASPDGAHFKSLYLNPIYERHAEERAILTELLPILEAAEAIQRAAA